MELSPPLGTLELLRAVRQSSTGLGSLILITSRWLITRRIPFTDDDFGMCKKVDLPARKSLLMFFSAPKTKKVVCAQPNVENHHSAFGVVRN